MPEVSTKLNSFSVPGDNDEGLSSAVAVASQYRLIGVTLCGNPGRGNTKDADSDSARPNCRGSSS